ncbi:hypothetical protein IWX90DRAFT_201903 [Phyllosticta citrichinensis]|uniref:Uncharacterized protein n=1 Tax=Phyllosticta citrichinensis TaxID=1130410 RepID=A0ABR1XXQ6_9PEZI
MPAMPDAPILSSLHTTTLPLPPSCIAFVPRFREWFVVGTYFLERGEEVEQVEEVEGQKRSGSMVLARLGEGEGRDVTITATHPTPFAVFDLHFSPHDTSAIPSSSHLLGLASSTGSIALYAIDPASATAPIRHIRTLQLFPTTSLFTYFCWHPTIPLLAAAALADGRVVLCDCSGNADDDDDDDDAAAAAATSPSYRRIVTLHWHALEAWVTAFAPDGSALYSGGDDAALKGVGLPAPAAGAALSASAYLAALSSSQPGDGEEGEEEVQEVQEEDAEEPQYVAPWQWQDARTHGAGLTFILPLPLPLPLSPHHHHQQPSTPTPTTTPPAPPLPPTDLLLTGSYDESLRLLSPPARNGLGPRRSRVLAAIELGGGVWRICAVDSRLDVPVAPVVREGSKTAKATAEWILLVSCMHAGTRVVRLTGTAACSAAGGNGDEKEGEGEGEGEGEWEWQFDVLARFEEHQSMNYGSAVQPLRAGEGKNTRTVVSTSFYDRPVCVWEF